MNLKKKKPQNYHTHRRKLLKKIPREALFIYAKHGETSALLSDVKLHHTAAKPENFRLSVIWDMGPECCGSCTRHSQVVCTT